MGHDDEEQDEEECHFPIAPQLARRRIFEGNPEHLVEGFDAVVIPLDGRLQADLKWDEARRKASQAIENGYDILWSLDLALFSGLAQPLVNQQQFLTLSLSIEHFRDTLWQEFKAKTMGLSLFRGPADFSKDFVWDLDQEHNFKSWLDENARQTEPASRPDKEERPWKRLFCRDVAVEYLLLLAASIPDTLPVFLFLDCSAFDVSLAEEVQYFNPERFNRFQLVLKKCQLPHKAMGWGSPTCLGYCGTDSLDLPMVPVIDVGICVPPMKYIQSEHYQGFQSVLESLQKLSIPYKLIAENSLTAEWDGLDYLLFNPSSLTLEGKRKLQGFCAAGGMAVSTGPLIGLSQELPVEEWLHACEKLIR